MEVRGSLTELWKRISSSFHNKSANERKGIVYIFDSPVLGYKRSVPAAIKGELDWVTQFIHIAEFQELFGGYITWHPTDEIAETIGVWGKRNVSRFMRILRERGAEFDVIDNEGPNQGPWVVTTHSYTKKYRRKLSRIQKSRPNT